MKISQVYKEIEKNGCVVVKRIEVNRPRVDIRNLCFEIAKTGNPETGKGMKYKITLKNENSRN